MKIRSTSWAAFFLLFSLTNALLSKEEVGALADGKKVSLPADGSAAPASKAGADGVGTKDAPVDGKDGRPHLGPFVETGAERDRKKAKESGEDATVSKAVPSSIAGTVLNDDGSKLPETNDGVMDDPNRTGPKEGTRGTEGGITEKSKDRSDGLSDGAKLEKKPDPPKEIPPLPHGDEKGVGQKPGKDDTKKGKETGTQDDGKDKTKAAQKELGGLEVLFLIVFLHQSSLLTTMYRNRPAFRRSPMISHIQSQNLPLRVILSQSSNPSRLPSLLSLPHPHLSYSLYTLSSFH